MFTPSRVLLFVGLVAAVTAMSFAIQGGSEVVRAQALIISVDADTDDNDDGTLDNGPSTVGTIDGTLAVAAGATNIPIDVVVQDAGALAAFEFRFTSAPAFTVQQHFGCLDLTAFALVGILTTAPGNPCLAVGGDSVPDIDGSTHSVWGTLPLTAVTATDGVLVRFYVDAPSSPACIALDVNTAKLADSLAAPIGDTDGDQIFDGTINAATLDVGGGCSLGTATATATATPPPGATATPTPTGPTPTPTGPTPTPTATPPPGATTTPTSAAGTLPGTGDPPGGGSGLPLWFYFLLGGLAIPASGGLLYWRLRARRQS